MQERTVPFVFSGTTWRYFGIFWSNIILSILTVFIYSAWAFVREKRYLYRNFTLDGNGFDYHERGLVILIGRIVAIVLLVGISFLIQLVPVVQYVLAAVALVLAPHLINRRIRRRLRMTSFRGVRFRFEGTYLGALTTYFILPIIGILSIGILAPFAMRAGNKYYAKHVSYGQRAIQVSLPVGPFYVAFIKTLGFAILVLIIGAVLALPISFLATTILGESTSFSIAFAATFGVLAYLGIVFTVPFYLAAKSTNIVAGRLALDDHRLEADFNPLEYARLSLVNVLMSIFSLGLLVPWAVIRDRRYTADHLKAHVKGNLDGYFTEVSDEVSSVTDEIADALDIDIDIPLG